MRALQDDYIAAFQKGDLQLRMSLLPGNLSDASNDEDKYSLRRVKLNTPTRQNTTRRVAQADGGGRAMLTKLSHHIVCQPALRRLQTTKVQEFQICIGPRILQCGHQSDLSRSVKVCG